MDKSAYIYSLDFQVRDYECDLQGVVNNAVYQNYLEHTRHEYLKHAGLDFAELTAREVFLVVVRAVIDYRSSLRSGEHFWVGLNFRPLSRLRCICEQDIFACSDERAVVNAEITWTALDGRGRPRIPAELSKWFAQAGVAGKCR